MSAVASVQQELTPASLWRALAGGAIGDELLEWPPDLFALTYVILERSEAYRFALSPPRRAEWPPARIVGWPDAVVDAAQRWSEWLEDRKGALPDLLSEEWSVFREGAGFPLQHLTDAHDWRMCEALLTLHAIADEACAGLGVALDATDGRGLAYRARGRELLARTGSLARIPTHFIRVLPKLRTPPDGTSLRSLARYASVHRPGVEVRWHKVPGRHPGSQPHDKGVNRLLLPWPLRIRESDFRPIPGSVNSLAKEPFGFFEFVPAEGLDLDLVDRMLVAAHDEVDQVTVVVLPESAVDDSEVDELEAVLSHHGVIGLVAGVRQRSEQPGQFPGNWVHIGVSTGERWVHIRQSKHHRWSLDESQIYQYHLGGALHPHIRWWEAMEVPLRSVQFVDVGEGSVVVSLVCEDLAQIDDVADVLRSVGPMVVITPLLDGPQLGSRWAARYASVLADDPGSTVLTLTSFGMARRSRPQGHSPSPVIALWKDPVRGIREITLEPGAQGVLISASADRATRRSSDGRRPIESGSEFFNMSIHQVTASSTGSSRPTPRAGPPIQAVLEPEDLTILITWAEALAEALAFSPERIAALPAHAHSGAHWRAALGIPEPSPQFDRAIDSIDEALRTVIRAGDVATPEAVLTALRDTPPPEHELDRLARRVLRAALEQRQTRRALCDDLRSHAYRARN
jgi:hypothetical protein